VLSKNIVFELY